MLTFATKMNLIMTKGIIDKVNYTIAFISEFAKAHLLTESQAYRYLERFKGMDFIYEFYDVEHTQSFRETVEDVTKYCHRMGGALV